MCSPTADTLECQVAIALADRDQAEIRRAPADVADENEIADADPPPPAIAERIEPGIEGGLRLFDQRHALEASTARRSHRQLTRLLVK